MRGAMSKVVRGPFMEVWRPELKIYMIYVHDIWNTGTEDGPGMSLVNVLTYLLLLYTAFTTPKARGLLVRNGPCVSLQILLRSTAS
jgi:hypothetical protein